MCVCCGILLGSLSSCSANLPIQGEVLYSEDSASKVQYSIVCVIHGDGDYIYHDASGNEFKADEEAAASAKKVARQNPNAEVFIFHQRPRQHFLLFFPLRDGEFFYYRNGQLIANELYWRDNKQSHFTNEVEFYRRFHVGNKFDMVSMFLYYGHEIPESGGVGYDMSYPDRAFTVDDLVSGLKGFTTVSAKYDLMILSTCFGGTPYTIGALGSFARTIIASPDNLHLSYLDMNSLEQLNLNLRDGDVPSFAKRFARKTFDRLTKDIQTEVSVAVYDMALVQEFLHAVQTVYSNTLNTLKGEEQFSLTTIEHCDCADLTSYQLPTINAGVEVFYRPAHFGRSKIKQNHSGWECWRNTVP